MLVGMAVSLRISGEDYVNVDIFIFEILINETDAFRDHLIDAERQSFPVQQHEIPKNIANKASMMHMPTKSPANKA